MEPFATVEELQARLDWTLDAGEQSLAEGALEDLSYEAHEFRAAWISAATAPPGVRNLVLKAAARFMRNPDGYTQSRAGDETLGWAEQRDPGSACFTEAERKRLAGLAGNNGFGTVQVYAWGNTRNLREGYVSTGVAGEKPFPMFSSDSSPW